MSKYLTILLSLFISSACVAPEPTADVGELSLALSTQAGGETYRLSKADFVLKGPLAQELSANGDDPIELTLPIGSYTLQLKDGWVLSRVNDPAVADEQGMTPVAATLDSQNPAALVIGPGATTQVMLRFSLSDGTRMEMDTGTLTVGVSIAGEGDDAGATAVDSCTHGLVINEIDYEQTGADDAEFVEILNSAACSAQLANVTLELVNGGDSKVYGRSALAAAGDTLAAGARLVVAQTKLLAALPVSVMRMALSSGGLQNGAPDAARLSEGSHVIDAVSYEGQVIGASEGVGTTPDDGDGSFSRCPDGFDQGDNATDFRLVAATPGAVNVCP